MTISPAITTARSPYRSLAKVGGCAAGGPESLSGSCVGTVTRTTGSQSVGPPQFVHMDAWGNLLKGHGTSPPEALPTQHLNCAPGGGVECQDGHWPDTPQVVAGPMQYHGSDGYESDVIDPDRGQGLPGMGRSTGFIHVGCRYYEPTTGRFLEYDPSSTDTSLAWGQTNRWMYCGNDPVNAFDAEGNDFSLTSFLAGVAIGMILGALMGGAIGYALWGADGILPGAGIGAAVGGAIGGILGALGIIMWHPYAQGIGIQLGSNLRLDWHWFKLCGQWVFRPHFHRAVIAAGKVIISMKRHRPWQ